MMAMPTIAAKAVPSSPTRSALVLAGWLALSFTAAAMGGFSLPGEWEEHRLPLKQFVPTFRGRVLSGKPPLDPAKVTSVGVLISDKQDGPFRLEIAWVHASLATP
jgi:hypothetical protein